MAGWSHQVSFQPMKHSMALGRTFLKKYDGKQIGSIKKKTENVLFLSQLSMNINITAYIYHYLPSQLEAKAFSQTSLSWLYVQAGVVASFGMPFHPHKCASFFFFFYHQAQMGIIMSLENLGFCIMTYILPFTIPKMQLICQTFF